MGKLLLKDFQNNFQKPWMFKKWSYLCGPIERGGKVVRKKNLKIITKRFA